MHARYAQITTSLCLCASLAPITHTRMHHLCTHVHRACVRAREAFRGRPRHRHAMGQEPGVLVVGCLLSAAGAGRSVLEVSFVICAQVTRVVCFTLRLESPVESVTPQTELNLWYFKKSDGSAPGFVSGPGSPGGNSCTSFPACPCACARCSSCCKATALRHSPSPAAPILSR